jgi:hypothetical protein
MPSWRATSQARPDSLREGPEQHQNGASGRYKSIQPAAQAYTVAMAAANGATSIIIVSDFV